MSAADPTPEEAERLQQFYLATRQLLSGSIMPATPIQRSFEEALAGFLGDETWRPTHISPVALRAAACGEHRRLQRAHGVIVGRLDRHERTLSILRGEEQPFEKWWPFFRANDHTVVITREEHAENRRFSLADLVEIPCDDRMLFTRGGFSFRFRKGVELEWVRSVLSASAASERIGEISDDDNQGD
jgi:hypothetical protein